MSDVLEYIETVNPLEYIEIVNPSQGIVDGAGDMIVITERNSNIPVLSPPFAAENVGNKRTDLLNPNNTTYPSTLAVANGLCTKLDITTFNYFTGTTLELNFYSKSDPQLLVNGGAVINNDSSGAITDDFIVNTTNYRSLYSQASGNSLTIMNCSLGKIGFFGQTPTTISTGWSAINGNNCKSYNMSATTITELSNTVGTLINELISKGLIST